MTPDQRLLANFVGVLVGVLVLVGVGVWAGYAWRDNTAVAELAECHLAHAADRQAHAEAAALAAEQARVREAKMAADHEEIVREAKSEIASVRADAARVRAALERLRKHVNAARSGNAPASAPAAAGSDAAPGTVDLPPDVLVRLGEAAGELAAYADEARTAGSACERAYRAVRSGE